MHEGLRGCRALCCYREPLGAECSFHIKKTQTTYSHVNK